MLRCYLHLKWHYFHLISNLFQLSIMLIEFERYPGVKWLFNQIPPHIGKRMLTVWPTNCPLVNVLLVLSQIRTKYRELRGKAGFPHFSLLWGNWLWLPMAPTSHWGMAVIHCIQYTCKCNIYKRFSCANRWNCTHAKMGRNQEFSEVDEAIVVPGDSNSVSYHCIWFDFSYDCHNCLWLKLYG